MKSLIVLSFLGASLVFVSFVDRGRQMDAPAGQVSCDVTTVPDPCKGSYVGSAGCGVFTVDVASWTFSYTMKLAATSTGNCNTNVDTAGLPCKAKANVTTLPAFACVTNVPGIPGI